MKITKPSQLREGMKVKFKRSGVPFSGWAYKSPDGLWIVSGGTGTGHNLGFGSFFDDITDVESAEGIRAAKEGDVLTNDLDTWQVLFANEYVVIIQGALSAPRLTTYDDLERDGFRIFPMDSNDPIEANGKKHDTARLVYIDEIETFMKRVINTTAIFMNKVDFEIYGDLTYLRKRAMEFLERIKELEPID